MRKEIFVLNEQRELFILVLLTLFPIMPIVAFIFTLIYWFLLLVVVWILTFIIIYLYFYSRLIVKEDIIIIKTFKNTYSIATSNIACLSYCKNLNYVNNVSFSFEFRENINIPKRYIEIKNKKFQKMIVNKTINIPIKSTIII